MPEKCRHQVIEYEGGLLRPLKYPRCQRCGKLLGSDVEQPEDPNIIWP